MGRFTGNDDASISLCAVHLAKVIVSGPGPNGQLREPALKCLKASQTC